jgi:glycogen operon protein
MLLGGDEIGRTQRGNNNAYCQDNEISWYDWSHADPELLRFAQEVVAIRCRHHVLRRRRFATGARAEDIRWFTPCGADMTDSDWNAGWTRSVVAYLDGTRDADRDAVGRLLLDDDLLLIVNGWWEELSFTVPDIGSPRVWRKELDTYQLGPGGDGPTSSEPHPAAQAFEPGAVLSVGPRSVVLLAAPSPD